MRVAILSMQRIINYGSVLQAYSLREIIRSISGVEADFIDIEKDKLISVNMPVRDEDDYKTVEQRKYPFFAKVRFKIRAWIRYIYRWQIRRFMKKELHVNSDNNKLNYDLIIVGSDEVFKSIDTINLQLYGDIKQSDTIITYAASSGSAVYEGIPEVSIPLVKKALSNYSVISVRDEGTYQYIKKLYSGIIERHLDPVLVGNLQFRPHKKVPLKRYMIIYAYGMRIHTEKEIESIKKFAKEHNLITVAIGGIQHTWCNLFLPLEPFRVLDYFYYADYIVTDTFHGAIFSIINNKKFAVLLRKTNENKLGDLLRRLGLEEQIVKDLDEFESVITRTIDYEKINKQLERERIRTKEYLKTYLCNI